MSFLKKKKEKIESAGVQEVNIGGVPKPPESATKERQGYEAEDFGAVAHFLAEVSNVNLIVVAELRAMRQEIKLIRTVLEDIKNAGG